jgi:hypothetical protein
VAKSDHENISLYNVEMSVERLRKTRKTYARILDPG